MTTLLKKYGLVDDVKINVYKDDCLLFSVFAEVGIAFEAYYLWFEQNGRKETEYQYETVINIDFMGAE